MAEDGPLRTFGAGTKGDAEWGDWSWDKRAAGAMRVPLRPPNVILGSRPIHHPSICPLEPLIKSHTDFLLKYPPPLF
jgi:hypothetical protein